MIFLKKAREGHRQSAEHWNHFKGSFGESSKRQGEALLGFSKGTDAILN